jgi:EmrB/QacA subfamily drug resistance transporter
MPYSASESPQPAYRIDANPRLRLLIPLVVACGLFMEGLDSTVINTAIPQMARSLGEAPLRLNLAVTAYLIALAVFIPISGWVADRFGARNVFCCAILLFTVGSVLCGLATSLEMLVATRIVQGMGGAMMTPVGRLILLRSFPKSELVRAMNYVTIPALVGPSIGPIVGGFLVTYASWRWIFFINLPIGIVSILLAWRYAENFRVQSPGHFDFTGFLLCGLGLASLQFGLENIGRHLISGTEEAALLGIALASLLYYGRHARRTVNPAVDLHVFGIKTFSIAVIWGGLSRIPLGSLPFLIPLLLQLQFGYSPFQSGLHTFLIAVGALTLKSMVSRLLRRFGYRRLLIGNSVVVAALIAGMASFHASTPGWLIAGYLLISGIFRSLQFTCSNTLGYADIPIELTSRATSVASVAQQLTMSFGVVTATSMLAIFTGNEGHPTLAAFQWAFMLNGALMLLPILGFLRLAPTAGETVSGHHHHDHDHAATGKLPGGTGGD